MLIIYILLLHIILVANNKTSRRRSRNATNDVLLSLNLDGKTEYEKVYVIYEYVTMNVDYDFDAEVLETLSLPHSCYASIIKKALCSGFSLLLYNMLLSVNIESRYITGHSGIEDHTWNIVKLDNLYYNLDSTFDRDLFGYRAFEDCRNIRRFYIKGTLTGVYSTAFNNTNIITLYCDSASTISSLTSINAICKISTNTKIVLLKKNMATIPTY